MSSFSISEYSCAMTSDELRLTVAKNIKRYRKLNGLTQMALAEKADLSVGYLCDLEAGGKWGMPETIVRLAAALNVQPFQLYAKAEEDTGAFSSDLRWLSAALKQNIDDTISDLLQKYN